jgi:Rps23 Pro-64 3,4-dihydroxylase Tpa1-like proline 4-hydroxylase
VKFLSQAAQLNDQYVAARPYPHIVLDDAFEQSAIDLMAENIRNIPGDRWLKDDHNHQMFKRWIANPNDMPPSVVEAISFFYSKEMVEFLEKLTGIQGLLIDPHLLGGGIHKTLRGGHLEVHADFNVHPQLNLHRRLNVLLYLNTKDWNPSWNGNLELWDRDMSKKMVSIPPIGNRMVIFSITDDAYHGHPAPLNTDERISLALYYYTSDRPEHEKAPFHWAAWQRRPR